MRPISKEPFIIEWMYDGWRVLHNNNLVSCWDHSDEDMGTTGLKDLFEYLEVPYRLVEVY